MKAIGVKQALPISNPDSLVDLDIERPEAQGRDLLVRIKAIAVNPVDFKVRQRTEGELEEARILGWDATGEVVATGKDATMFAPGDAVYYAGDLTRQGSNAEYQLVDERLVGRKPASLSDAEAAAMPLTTITAWEMLFERLAVQRRNESDNTRSDEVLLVVGASGGVGSILVQLASKLTGATIIATASRPSSQEWVRQLGAHHVVDHSQPLTPQIQALGLGDVTHIASLTHTDSYLDSYAELIRPAGRLALIDDPESLNIASLKPRSVSVHWEFMFTRSMFRTEDMIEQHRLLDEVADLVDQGVLRTTMGENLGSINAANLRKAHELLESGKSIGKLVLEGF